MLVANCCGVATAWLTSVNYETSWYISLLLDNALNNMSTALCL